MSPANGESPPGSEPPDVDLKNILFFKTLEGGLEREYKVVGLVEDDEANTYAVGLCEKEDEYIVTDAKGNLLGNNQLAQEILDDFLVFLEEAGDEEKGGS